MKCTSVLLPLMAGMIAIVFTLGSIVNVNAQTLHERTWFFGAGQALEFNNGQSQTGGIPAAPGHNFYLLNSGNVSRTSTAVSDSRGVLQFFIQVRGVVTKTSINGKEIIYNHPKIFDAQGRPFPNGNIIANLNEGNSYPLSVVPYPGDTNLYYLLFSFEGALTYSLIDMRLNGGSGDVVDTQKDQHLLGYGKVIGTKMSTIAGCDAVWLVVRSRISNAYYSFKIDNNGIHKAPVVSEAGLVPLTDYVSVDGYYGGLLKASNDNLTLAAGTQGGVELYDFEPCSGRLKNARLIDTLPAMGLCFSPDNTKLYASYSKTSWWGAFQDQGEVYQYDLNRRSLAAIKASRTLVMRNPYYELITFMGPEYYSGPLAELKLGLDGRIYVSKNNQIFSTTRCSVYYSGSDYDPVPIPATSSCLIGQYMHVIHQPNLPGSACDPELDYLKLNDRVLPSGLLLQSDIKTAPVSTADTLSGKIIPVLVCFEKEVLLSAPDGSGCLLWDNGSAEAERKVERAGTYWLQYIRGCTHHTDTFKVVFAALPEIPQLQYNCPGKGKINIPQSYNDKTLYTYTLTHLNSSFREVVKNKTGYQFVDLASGAYRLRIQSGSCDTTLALQLEAYPAPEVSITQQDTLIRYGDTLNLEAYGAAQFSWWPSMYISEANSAATRVWPVKPTEYLAIGRNAYGCVDTARIRIDLNYNLPDILPNAFSPNGDGLNDEFRVAGLTYQQILQFRVYNRFGQVVYHATGSGTGWDGTFNGKPCDAGTYYYRVALQYPDGSRKVCQGDVALIR